MPSAGNAGGALAAYAAKAGITIDVPTDLVVNADRDRLFGVLDSILANAVNFSKPPRTIAIECYYPEGEDQFSLSFQDNGIGIAETALSSIFEPFQLADASKLSRKYARIGLSLSIAKKIIEMHGGSIKFYSQQGEGTTVTVNVPR